MIKKNELSVICATLPGINPGMQSVNYAFKYISEKYSFSKNVVYYKMFEDRISQENNGSEIKFEILPENLDFLKKSKRILFWGDFLHMLHYQSAISNRLVALHLYKDYQLASKRVREIFLLENFEKKIFKKVYSFGTTLLFNSMNDLQDAQYSNSLEQFIINSQRVWVRDIVSALKISHLKNDYTTNFLGVDCALLIEPKSIYKLDNKKNTEKKIGIFLGRTKNYISEILNFSRIISNRINFRCNWINWGDMNAFPTLTDININNVESPVFDFNLSGTPDVEKALVDLLDYSLVITDTYHICVNSWNLGIPAICFYGLDNFKDRDVNYGNIYTRSDKRQVFYSMYDALDFLISFDELNNEELIERRINHIILCLKSNLYKEITFRIRNHSNEVEKKFIKSLL